MTSNTLPEYENYFKEIARTNKLIKGFVMGGADDIISASRSDINYPGLWLEIPNMVFTDNGTDQIEGQRHGAITVLKNGEYTPAQKAAVLQECETILLQILGKMRKDRKARLFSFSLHGSTAEAISQLFVDNDYGWRLEFHIDKNIEVCYHAEHWDSEKTL